MARMSKTQIAALPPGRHGDGDWLYVQVSDTGAARTWVMRYPSPLRPSWRRDFTIGSVETWTSDDAHDEARRIKRLIKVDRRDPHDERAAQREEKKGAITLEQAAKAAIAFRRRTEWKKPDLADRRCKGDEYLSEQDWRRSMEMYVYPLIGSVDVNEIGREHILMVLQQKPTFGRSKGVPLWDGINQAATRVRERLEYILDFATAPDQKWRDATKANPAQLSLLSPFPLGEPKKVRQKKVPHAALPFKRLPEVFRKLGEFGGMQASACQVVMLTVKREKEVALARWPEVDLVNLVWTIPAERMKGKKWDAGDFREPITPPLLAIFKRLWEERAADDGFVFPGRPRSQPIVPTGVLKPLRELDIRIGGANSRLATVHGLRTAMKAWANVRNPETTHRRIEKDLSEMCIAHDLRTDVQKSYDHDPDLFDDRTPVMEKWAAFVASEPIAPESAEITKAA